ncbi:ankyrin [Heliocybe sulcata]|uniref:Ankyrin n=1 Tax=Heliocybe sulcata TaxID=5364 RepID=A0A5C3NIS4_9AGAM|nr:ankyrin [Heliocybe sulcata]
MAEKDASARLRRAVQENNLFLVKRLIQRTDMRNPDPVHRRFTSLAWAAVMGHEETFEFLLTAGHDDEELSKDTENNTILTLLADLKPPSTSPFALKPSNPDLMQAALRMARMYYDRYPFVLDWANSKGRTALHVASLRGNEELVRMLLDLGADYDLADNEGNTPLHYASAWGHIPIVQLLIERGCQFTARNNEGFTASDYAYSFSTKETLQDAARLQFENNKKARRQVFAQAAARGNEMNGAPPAHLPPSLLARSREAINGSLRMRSGSGGSRTTVTSDSDLDNTPLPPPRRPHADSQSSISTTSSPSQISSSSSFYHLPIQNSGNASASSSASTFSPVSPASHSANSSRPHILPNPLAPIASRVREHDADAIARYRQTRNRSGSADTAPGIIDTLSNNPGPSTHTNGLPPLPVFSNGGAAAVMRRLRPSASAAQLRSPPPTPIAKEPLTLDALRNRSGTTPTRPTPLSFSPPRDKAPQVTPPRTVSREASLNAKGPPRDPGEYKGPPSDYAQFPPPPDRDAQSQASQTTPTATRRLPFNLLSKPLPSIDPQLAAGGHKRGNSATSLRS